MIADKLIVKAKKDENKLLSLCDKEKVRIEYRPFCTNIYIFKDNSSIVISRGICNIF